MSDAANATPLGRSLVAPYGIVLLRPHPVSLEPVERLFGEGNGQRALAGTASTSRTTRSTS
jgi:hypothetical protein